MPNTFKLIESKTLTSNQSAIEFTSIPQTYTDLCVVISARSTRSQPADVVIRFNNSSSNLINARFAVFTGSSVFTDGSEHTNFSSAFASANTFSNAIYYVYNYTTSKYKTWTVDNAAANDGTLGVFSYGCGTWENTAAVTSIKITDIADGGVNNLITNSTAYLYGILKA